MASGAPLRHPLARLLVAAPMLLAPVAENRAAEVYNRPVCLHFFALYALFWVLLWPAGARRQRVAALVTAGLTAASTILVVALVPLALLRLAARRDRHSLALAGLVTAGAAVQVGHALLVESRGRPAGARLDPLWALGQYAAWAVPESILGFRATSGLYVADAHFAGALSRNVPVVVAAWLVVLLVLAVAVVSARRGLLRPRWVLAATLAAHSAGLLALEIMANGWISQRYLLAPSMLLFGALVALLAPAPDAVPVVGAAAPPDAVRAVPPSDAVPVARPVGAAVPLADAVLAPSAVPVSAAVRSAAGGPAPAAVPRAGVVPLLGLAALLLIAGAANFRWTDTNRHDAPRWTEQVREAAVRCNQDRTLTAVAARGGPPRHPSYVVIPCHELRGGPVRCDGRTCVKLLSADALTARGSGSGTPRADPETLDPVDVQAPAR